MDDCSGFSDRLAAAIKEKNLTNVEVARQLGISKHSMTNYLKGRIPEAVILYSMAQFFGKTMEWFLTGRNGTIVPQSKKDEAIIDLDLIHMVDVLKSILSQGDPELRAWAKIQFQHAFSPYIDTEKKSSRVADSSSTYRA